MDKGQIMRYSKDELELIKLTFGGENQVLYALRNLFLQFELNDEDKHLLQFSEEQKTLVKKVFLPEYSKDIPIFQQVNLYHSLQKIREWNVEPAMNHIFANDIVIQYLKQQWSFLESKFEEKPIVVIEKLPKEMGNDQDELRFINMLAFHNITAFVEGRISEIKALVGLADETEEEQNKRLAMNSSK